MQRTDLPLMRDAALVAAQALRQGGLNIDVQTMDWATLVQRRAKQDRRFFPRWIPSYDALAGLGARSPCTIGPPLFQSVALLCRMKSPTRSGGYFSGRPGPVQLGRQATTASKSGIAKNGT
jgi:ABC-type transport system substrate-binding protein